MVDLHGLPTHTGPTYFWHHTGQLPHHTKPLPMTLLHSLPQPVILVCLVLMPDSPSSLVARGNQEQARWDKNNQQDKKHDYHLINLFHVYLRAVLTWLDQDTEERLCHLQVGPGEPWQTTRLYRSASVELKPTLQGRSGGSRAPGLVATLAKLGRPANHRPLLVRQASFLQLLFLPTSVSVVYAPTRQVCYSSWLFNSPESPLWSSSVSGAKSFAYYLTFWL